MYEHAIAKVLMLIPYVTDRRTGYRRKALSNVSDMDEELVGMRLGTEEVDSST